MALGHVTSQSLSAFEPPKTKFALRRTTFHANFTHQVTFAPQPKQVGLLCFRNRQRFTQPGLVTRNWQRTVLHLIEVKFSLVRVVNRLDRRYPLLYAFSQEMTQRTFKLLDRLSSKWDWLEDSVRYLSLRLRRPKCFYYALFCVFAWWCAHGRRAFKL